MKRTSICFLIENDEDDREIFALALRAVDNTISIVFADNGVDAIEQLYQQTEFTPSFIFIDMNMPLMNGMQCLQEIKKIDRLIKVPVYIYSTATDPKFIAEVKRLGATEFILKPSRFQEFSDILFKLLQGLNSNSL